LTNYEEYFQFEFAFFPASQFVECLPLSGAPTKPIFKYFHLVFSWLSSHSLAKYLLD